MLTKLYAIGMENKTLRRARLHAKALFKPEAAEVFTDKSSLLINASEMREEALKNMSFAADLLKGAEHADADGASLVCLGFLTLLGTDVDTLTAEQKNYVQNLALFYAAANLYQESVRLYANLDQLEKEALAENSPEDSIRRYLKFS